CVATLSAPVVSVAEPPLSVLVPRFIPGLTGPSQKVTESVGVPEPGPVPATVGVKVTNWPKTGGLDAPRSMVVLPRWTDWATEPELILKLLLPSYRALMVCGPTDNELSVSTAWPVPSSVLEPRLLVPTGPSKKVTVPPGWPLPRPVTVTVAVKVTES